MVRHIIFSVKKGTLLNSISLRKSSFSVVFCFFLNNSRSDRMHGNHVIEILTVPMPSMANRTVAKNSGMWPTGAIHGRDPMSGNGIAAVPSSMKGLAPTTTHAMVQPNPTSMNEVAAAENGTSSRSERMMPSGSNGNARPNIQARMEKCHSVWLSTTWTRTHLI